LKEEYPANIQQIAALLRVHSSKANAVGIYKGMVVW